MAPTPRPRRVPAGMAAADLTAREVAEALWLATRLDAEDDPATPDLASGEPPSRKRPPAGAELERLDEAGDNATGDDTRPERPTPERAAAQTATGADPGELAETAAESELTEPLQAGGPGPEDADEEGGVGLPVVVARRASDPARRAAQLANALRPLRQHLPSSHRQVPDEEATAERMAQDPCWLPVYRAGREPRWDAVVVMDGSPSMSVWWETVADFVAMLGRHGAFRDVRLTRLHTDPTTPEGLTVHGMTEPAAAGRSPDELLAPPGRRIILVLTDGLAPAWQAGAALPVLRAWGQSLPVAAIHLLPRFLWHRTGLAGRGLRLRPRLPWAANAQLAWACRDAPPDLLDEASAKGPALTPVPVLALDPRWLAAWSRLLTDRQPTGWTDLTGVIAGPWKAPADDAPGQRAEQSASPRERVAAFMAGASPSAFRLATLLAGVPLNLPAIRGVWQALSPWSAPSDVSELFLSGLVRRSESARGHPADPANPAAVAFEFEPGVRAELLAHARRADTLRAWRAVGERLRPHVPVVDELLALLDRPGEASVPTATATTAPFLASQQAAFAALAGPYARLADGLSAALSRLHVPAGSAPRSEVTSAPPPVPAVRAPTPTLDVTTPLRRPDPPRPDTFEASAQRRASTPPDAPSDPASAAESGVRQGGENVTSTTTGGAVDQRHPANRPAVWGNVPQRNPNFTGREELLAELDERLRAGTTAVLPEALHGMGGVGKSQLAVEYVYRHAADYEVVWWIPSERPAQVVQALAELAQRLGLPVGREANSSLPAVREALRTGKPYPNWLLVFDNAESPETVREYFPSDGPGSILVTSRNRQWGGIARSLEVDVFTRPESVQLLRRRGPELTDAEADQLADSLGDLPLAIEQAAAWRAETGMTAAEYLEVFQEKRLELLEVSPPADYQLPVAAAWNVSLDQVEVKNPAALQLLQICSFFAAEPIARNLFSGARTTPIMPEIDAALRDPIRLGRAIREINRYSLARIDQRTNSLLMHRLVQTVLVRRMSEDDRERMRHGAHLLLAANDPNDPRNRALWPRYATLYPHVLASKAVECDDPFVRELVMNVANYLYRWGDHEAARDLSQRAYDSWRLRSGEDDPQTLNMARWLSFMLFAVGRYDDAAELTAHTLAVYERTVPEDNEDLLDALGAAAAVQRFQGDFAAGLELSQTVYDRALRAFGDDDATTLAAAHNLGVNLRLSGEYTQALTLDQDTLRRKAEIYGEDHETTLITNSSVVLDTSELGDYLSAHVAQEALVEKYRDVVGRGNPGTYRAMRHLSVVRRRGGDHARARELSEQATTYFNRRYGKDHPDSAAAALNLSVDLRQTGELEQAAELGAETEQRYARMLGERHPHTLSAAVNLAITLRLSGDEQAALASNERTLAAFVERLGPDHPNTLVCATNLASDHFCLGDHAAAHRLDVDTSRRLAERLGPDHPTALACAANLALDTRALGQAAEAEALHERTLQLYRVRLGEGHPATVDAVNWQRANCDIDPMPL